MVCPNCGSNISDKRKRCDRCGTDLELYKKIIRTSNLYYNNGLARAKVRDLSGAEIALRKSLELNKSHIDARNLLGLVYYEMGETVAALSEWVISRHLKSEDNDAEEYINKVQSNPTRLDALNQAIKRYNTALNFARQGSDDLAVIQLKKVLNLNPHFLRAYQLLSLLYMKAGENEKARKFLTKASKIDVSNTKTLRYLQEMEAPPGKDPDANPEAEQGSTAMNNIIPISSYKEDKPNIMAYVNLVIGVVIGITAMAILVIPTIKKNVASEGSTNSKDNTSVVAQLQEAQNQNSTLKNENTDLQKQVKKLQTKVDSSTTPDSKTTAYTSVMTAVGLYLDELAKSQSQRDYNTLAEKLAAIDDTALKDDSDTTKLLTKIRDEVYPVATQSLYDSGHTLYGRAKYEDALKDLAKALTYDPKNVDAIYFTGRSYDRLGDKEKAAQYYNQIINDFPDSVRVSEAKTKLRLLQ